MKFRRFAFNSLLRGDKPIRARLRPLGGTSLGAEERSSDAADDGELDRSESGASATSSHGFLSSAVEGSANSAHFPPDMSFENPLSERAVIDQISSRPVGKETLPSRKEAIKSSTHGKLRSAWERQHIH
jgi:hypothetical protein